MGHPVPGAAAVLAATGLGASLGVGTAILSTFAALIGAFVALRSNARTARHEYQEEMAAARKGGADEKAAELKPVIDTLREQARRDAADLTFWRAQALGRGDGP